MTLRYLQEAGPVNAGFVVGSLLARPAQSGMIRSIFSGLRGLPFRERWPKKRAEDDGRICLWFMNAAQ
jgi:hypothetical protein